MTILTINTGTSPNSGDGDSLRLAFHKINLNFSYLNTASGAAQIPALGDIQITNSTFTTTGTNQSIFFDPNGTGRVRFLNTPISFDDGATGNIGYTNNILYTKGSGSRAGLGLNSNNNSLRIIGDENALGAVVDVGLYNNGSWESKLFVDYNGNVTATGIVKALGGIQFADGTLQSSAGGLTVSYITTNTITGTLSNIRILRFDTLSGFSLTDLGGGAVKVGMNSTFKYWEVPGQPTLVADGLDTVRFIAGSGIAIETSATSVPQTITIRATGGGGAANLGSLAVDDFILYPTTSTKGIVISNRDTLVNPGPASYLSLPPLNANAVDPDVITPVVLSSPNEIRITSSPSSTNPISIIPNDDGLGPGYVVVGTGGQTTSTIAGTFIYSANAEIDFWPNKTLALYNHPTRPWIGTLDLYTYNNNNISLRPNGTGTVVVSSDLEVLKHMIYSTNNPGAGVSATSSTYQSVATLLDITKQVHKLSGGDYYMPPGKEGMLVYFVPTTNPGITKVWFQSARTVTGNFDLRTNAAVNPFADGLCYGIYTDGAWTLDGGQVL